MVRTKRNEPCVPYDTALTSVATPSNIHAVSLQSNERLMTYSVQSLCLSLPGNEEERRSLHYYHTTAVQYISGYFESAFWYRDVLQLSHSVTSVRHALLAISFMYESMEKQRRIDPGRATSPSRSSLEHYNKAIRHLVREIQTQSNECKGTATIACLLFAWLEELFGNHLRANDHVISGLKILQHPIAGQIPEGPPVSTFLSWPPFRSLVWPAIMGFVRQVVSGSPLYYSHLSFSQEIEKEGPFNSIEQARVGLEANVNASTFLLRQAQSPTDNNALQLRARLRLYDGLGVWQSHYLTFLEKYQKKLSARERRASIVLQIGHIITTTILRSCFTRSEMEYDKLQPDFARLVALVQSIMDPIQSAHFGYDRLPDYSFEGAVIFPLYFTALKCRNSRTRREALDLLRRGPTKEGIWERDLAVKIATRVLELEEQDCGFDEGGDHILIPEERMISRLNVTVNYEFPEYFMEVWRGSLHSNMDNRACEQYRSKW